ncbi:MAG: NUDIX domain-containing protein [Nitrososphaerota archaeon]|nr:NUDIX domain-containing protein [Nitrososphaerota archaeon]
MPEGGEGTAAVGAILDPRSHVLVVKRAVREGDPWSGQWALPGGRWTLGDSDLLETLRREVLEETGIDITMLEPIGWLGPLSPMNRPGLKVHVLALLARERPQVRLNYELSDFRWVRPSVMRRALVRALTSFGEREVEAMVEEDVVIWGLTYRILDQLYSSGFLRSLHTG